MENNLEHKLDMLSWVSNRGLGQTKFLLSLCDDDFDKLLSLEARLKKLYYGLSCPGDKETVDRLLVLDVEHGKYSQEHLEAMMRGGEYLEAFNKGKDFFENYLGELKNKKALARGESRR